MIIETDNQYYAALAQIETIIEKGFSHLTHSETVELERLSESVEGFETKKYPLPIQEQ
jgi:antitoxin component HigA of HigAB toxin-antitoxin module